MDLYREAGLSPSPVLVKATIARLYAGSPWKIRPCSIKYAVDFYLRLIIFWSIQSNFIRNAKYQLIDLGWYCITGARFNLWLFKVFNFIPTSFRSSPLWRTRSVTRLWSSNIFDDGRCQPGSSYHYFTRWLTYWANFDSHVFVRYLCMSRHLWTPVLITAPFMYRIL